MVQRNNMTKKKRPDTIDCIDIKYDCVPISSLVADLNCEGELLRSLLDISALSWQDCYGHLKWYYPFTTAVVFIQTNTFDWRRVLPDSTVSIMFVRSSSYERYEITNDAYVHITVNGMWSRNVRKWRFDTRVSCRTLGRRGLVTRPLRPNPPYDSNTKDPSPNLFHLDFMCFLCHPVHLKRPVELLESLPNP